MIQEIKAIDLGGVNCYLIKANDGYLLVDTGYANKRTELEKQLENAGCKPGNLKLIVLTHGDSDHADNASYVRERFGAQIAMHKNDLEMVERGDMSWNRKAKPDKVSFFFKVVSLLVKPGKFESFIPDFFIDEGFELSKYGFEASVIHLPGHSKGSIGILTKDGNLICGDLIYNLGKPGFPFYSDDLTDFNTSIEKLKNLTINTVYPGHGKPFPMKKYLK